jgi:cytochrome P450
VAIVFNNGGVWSDNTGMAGLDQKSGVNLASTMSRSDLPESVGLKKATPGPQGLISFDAQLDPLAFLGDLIQQYGDVTRYQTRFGPCFLFVHPEHVQTILHREKYRRASLVKMMLGEGLLASDGARWRSQRRLMQRDFLPASIERFVPVMTLETTRTAADWQAAASAGGVVDITSAMTRLTLRIVVAALFSDDLSADHAAQLCDAVTDTITDLGKISWTIFGMPTRFTPDCAARFAAAKNVIDAACYDMIARRRGQAPSGRPRDLLTMLIESDTGAGAMNDRQLRDEIVTMLVGGHETTALALAWAWKAVAERPDIKAFLQKELDEHLAGRLPGIEDLPRLPWTSAVFHEAMRLYPPVWYMARVAQEDDVIHGHAVPRGACVLVSAWFTHRHKDFWPDAERFDPRRFVDPSVRPSHRYAYFPFGGGRHQCLGMHFALMEGIMILAQLAQQFHVYPLNAEQIKPAPGITLRQSPGMVARVELRTAQSSLKCAATGAV